MLDLDLQLAKMKETFSKFSIPVAPSKSTVTLPIAPLAVTTLYVPAYEEVAPVSEKSTPSHHRKDKSKASKFSNWYTKSRYNVKLKTIEGKILAEYQKNPLIHHSVGELVHTLNCTRYYIEKAIGVLVENKVLVGKGAHKFLASEHRITNSSNTNETPLKLPRRSSIFSK